jgi:hypothetical protein
MRVIIRMLLAASLTFTAACKTTPREDLPLAEGIAFAELSSAQASELGAWVAATYGGEGGEAPAFLREGRGSAYVALRQQGKLLAEVWGDDGQLGNSLAGAVTKAKEMMPAGSTPDMVEINLAHSFQSVANPTKTELSRLASGKRTGIRGIELTYGEHYERTPPTKMLTAGDKFDDVIGRFFKRAEVTHDSFVSGGGKARVFESQQLIVRLPSGEGVKLLRGNVYVEPSAVTQANTQMTVDLLIEWMLTNLEPDGRLAYMWLPGESREKPNDNNMIRQWMGTNALIKVAEKRNDPQLWDRIAKNIDYNLEHFYKQEGEFGVIEYENQVKLGAVSLAAMAIISHPQRARWQTQEHGLRRTVAELWAEDGFFEGFYKPRNRGSNRNDNVQNFYPGETLLLWAQLYSESRDPELLRRFVQSFRYYKAWHLDPSDPERRRPSFTPWHTQAYFIVWEALREPPPATPAALVAPVEGEGQPPKTPPDAETPPDPKPDPKTPPDAETPPDPKPDPKTPPDAENPDAPPVAEASPAPTHTPEGWPIGTTPETPVQIEQQELVDFVFEMNDWLIENMEVWEESAFDDEKGQFHSRERDYGAPHASATGVYIEGIIDAYAMAKAVGDTAREERYRLSLSRAIRSVMQLQFVDDIDMFYVTDRVRTKGGLRTTVIRNEVRVDNVQHVLMGLLKLLDRFAANDYRTD